MWLNLETTTMCSVQFWFVSFIAFLTATQVHSQEKCEETIYVSYIRKIDIYSPGYEKGQNYPPDTTCIYHIFNQVDQEIYVEFEFFDLEESDGCEADYLRIFDGKTEGNPILWVMCGSDKPRPIVSNNGGRLILDFTSDYMINKRGFHLKVSPRITGYLCSSNELTCKNRNCVPLSEKCNGNDACGDGTDEENCGFVILPSPSCGQPAIEPYDSVEDDRIIGGKEAKPGSWPWQADLQIALIEPNGHACGGALVNAEWVVTASHCFIGIYQPNMWKIILGNHDKFKKEDSEQVRYAAALYIYPDKRDISEEEFDYTNDITLIKLNGPVKFTKEVSPVCLPSSGYREANGTKCVATGWGMTRGTGSANSLKQSYMNIYDKDHCEGAIEPVDDSTMLCTSNLQDKSGVCHGDSGGPLVCKRDGKWFLSGLTSAGTQMNYISGLCAITPTFFTRVSAKIDWINRIIANN